MTRTRAPLHLLAFLVLWPLLCCEPRAALADNAICSDVTPATDTSNRCANTRFVWNAISASPFFISCPAHQFVNAIGALASICAQPNFTDLAGSITGSQIPSGTISNAKLAVGTANTIKASLDGVNEIDTGIPNCSLLQYTSGTGFSCATAARILLGAPTTFNVATNGINQPGCGSGTGTAACATRQYLVDNVLQNYDLNNKVVTVQIADGTYTDSLQELRPMLLGQAGAGGLIFTGNCTTPSNVLIQPAAGAGYTYGFAFGFSARIQCQELDQTTGVRAGSSNDMVVVGQGSRLLMGNGSLFGVHGDMVYGCNVNPFNTFTVGPQNAYLEFDNDFTINPILCQVSTIGSPTNGSATISAVTSTANVVKYQGIIATNVPSDAYVLSTTVNSITFGCIYTSPCQANGTPGSVAVTITGGGQNFVDTDSSQFFANTNGDPSFSIIGTLANFPFYYSGWFFINDQSLANAQAITWVNPGQGRGRCSAVSNISVLNTNFQGIPYFPCNALQPEASPSGVSVTAGNSTFTVGSASGIVRGQVATDVVVPTATWTAGSSTMVVSSATGIVNGAKVSGPGILAGAFVTNISGTTITVGGCGTGPRCVSSSPLYLSESGQTVWFSNGLFSGGSVVTNVSGTTITISDTIKNTGTASNVWFQGRVTPPSTSIYD